MPTSLESNYGAIYGTTRQQSRSNHWRGERNGPCYGDSGGINTPLLHKHIPGGEATTLQLLQITQPLARPGTPEDIAGMALYLASDDAEWVTGTAMIVDGGFVARGNAFAQQSAFETPGKWSGPSFEKD